MPKFPDGAFLEAIGLDRESGALLHVQIYENLRKLIISGMLSSGMRLPSSRVLMVELGVSRTTVRHAFDRLIAEGYLFSHRGSGTRVAPQCNDALILPKSAGETAGTTTPLTPARLSARGDRIAGATAIRGYSHARPFVPSIPGLDQFPHKTWARVLARQWHRHDDGTMGYGELAGYLPLRKAIATYLVIARGIICNWEQVVIVAGAQQAFGLIANMLLDPGDSVWVEEPGYSGANGAFVASGLNLVPVPVDEYGLNVQAGVALAPHARLALITPSHQLPLGMVMPVARRLEVLDWARRTDAWVIEDDYDSEFRYTGRPLSALQGLDQYGRTIYVGTFSKVLFPSLRLGYLVTPPNLSDQFASANGLILKGPPTHLQAAVAEFMTDGHFARHIRRMRKIYKERQQVVLASAQAHLGGLLDVSPSDSGMHVIGWLANDVDDRAVSEAAAKRGIEITPLSSCYQGKAPRNGLLLGFASSPPDKLRKGIVELASAIREVAGPTPA
ncbi:PLP-dependent aminotransferase family protein [Rhodobacteraceae bacterium R_SAG10]|jgi:GntR family transcriptional regulator/MocR family aminotransferase|nr:PLP-dependent aminotransferase family protein [Rhodobacteraceae bacterium R_SAG10]